MRWPGILGAVALLTVLAVPARPAAAAGVRLAIACGALGLELTLCRDATREWARQTGNQVDIINTPNSSTDRFALYVQLLSSRSPDIDVLQIDVVWPGMLAIHLADLTPTLGDRTAAVFPALIANNKVAGRLVAMPWYVDVGVLYYRKDLLARHGLPPPRTWAELARTAARIQSAERAAGNARLWGYVFQGKAYEGLTCNMLEWAVSHGGGTFIDGRRRVTANNPQAVAALAQASGWIGSISPRGVLNYDEEAARGVFQTGGALFMRNWPYAWALAQSEDSPVRGKVGVAALPAGGSGGSNAGTLGGWQLAVSRYSRHPREAMALVRYLTSAQVQKDRAIRGAYNPTIVALYRDQEILAANPFFAALLPSLQAAVPRPARQAGPRYNQVSDAIWRAGHDALSGKSAPAAALARLETELDRIAFRAGWQ